MVTKLRRDLESILWTSEVIQTRLIRPKFPTIGGKAEPSLKPPLRRLRISGQFRSSKMGSRLGRRVVHFANLPIKLLMPSSFTDIREIALKTIPSASKIEIKRVLESLYGFEVEKVRTLNMEGKKKQSGGLLIAKPDYKKAYVTLRNPLSLSNDLFPVKFIEEEKRRKEKGSSFVEEEDDKKRHWLDGKEKESGGNERGRVRRGGDRASSAAAKFPWSSMRHGGKRGF